MAPDAAAAAAAAAEAQELAAIVDLLCKRPATAAAPARGSTETAPGAAETAAQVRAGSGDPTWRGAKAGPSHTCL